MLTGGQPETPRQRGVKGSMLEHTLTGPAPQPHTRLRLGMERVGMRERRGEGVRRAAPAEEHPGAVPHREVLPHLGVQDLEPLRLQVATRGPLRSAVAAGGIVGGLLGNTAAGEQLPSRVSP